MYNQHIKPKKVYLNYNYIKREFQTERSIIQTRTSSVIEKPAKSLRNSLVSLSVDCGKSNKTQSQKIRKYAYLFYVDENGLNDYLKFNFKQILESFTKNCIPNLLNEQTYALFLPYSQSYSFPQSRFQGDQFTKVKDVQQLINFFHQLKISGEEYQIQKMFDYFFVPSRELAIQVINDLKFQLAKMIKKPIKVISFFDGIEILNACQLGWNPPTLVCADSKETLIKQLPKIKESIRISKRIKQLQKFKQQMILQCCKQDVVVYGDSSSKRQELIRQNLKQIKQIQQLVEYQKEYDVQLPKLVVQNIYPKFKVIQPSQELEDDQDNSIDHLSLEMINSIKQSNPKLDNYLIYKYYIDYKSLCMLNSIQNGIPMKYFVIYNENLSGHCQNELLKIYRALGVNVDSGIFRWKEYLLFRILQDNCGNPFQVIQFLLHYFMNDNQELSDISVRTQLYQLSQRLNQYSSSKQETISKAMSSIESSEQSNTFADRFALTIIKWMHKNGFFVKDFLNKEIMLQQYERNEYTFLFIINCILGQFKTNVLEWFYNIY
ncbi:unnamed protein product (macronuclear) [Paramecium tetraurelia]|uniref:Uncharacterized protein n=1 Tax=Paramecium tetraurelia TaxID=5888 RepID=A0BI19_PARTE|nr:uncharacterized protein GSPATT00029222001 [Paramecium tetraurelia]CAK58186.1 unnamed protein product [Paramecium tetraurelia]|eukprot:XP_001425584.1 hypothetical protein (macronuclear) [Paramecium tetraurelia strain d4-2]